jgi:AraC-like DNA-binding protein
MNNINLGQVSIAAVNQYLQLAKAQQIEFSGILNELKIPTTLLSDNSKQLSGSVFQQLIKRLVALSNDQLFGLHTAQFVQPSSYSVLGYISMNCETLGEAMSKIPAFEKLVGDMGTTSFDERAEHYKISWHCLYPDKLVRRHMIDNCLASWLNFAHYLAEKKTAPAKIHFTRKKPTSKEQQEYEALFNCQVLFNQSSDSIYFRKSLLNYPLNRGNKKLLTTLEKHAIEQLDNLNNEKTIVSQASLLISQNLQSGNYHQQDIADALNIGTKTLQRRLKAESSNFQIVLDKTRLNQASLLLESRALNLSEISQQLGFQETSSFYRWFSKLMKQTPGQYRKTLEKS